MTVIIGIGVFPSKTEKPYFLMASDSLRVRRIQNDDGTFEDFDRDENYQKFYKYENIIYGFAGKMDDFFMEELPRVLSDLKGDFKQKAQTLNKIVKKYMKNECTLEIGRCNFVMGTIEKGVPVIAQSLIIKEYVDDSKLNIEKVPYGNAIPVFIGNVQGNEDLQEKFMKRVQNAINLNSYVVKKAAREYVVGIADRVPEYCNKNVKMDII